MFNKASDFSMQDQSSKPYAWMIEGISFEEIFSYGVERWIREYVKTAINTQNHSKASDKGVYKVWRSGSEFKQIYNFVMEEA